MQCSFLFNNFSIESYSSLVYPWGHEESYMRSEKGPYSRSSVSIKNTWLGNRKASTYKCISRRLLYLPILGFHRGFQDAKGERKRFCGWVEELMISFPSEKPDLTWWVWPWRWVCLWEEFGPGSSWAHFKSEQSYRPENVQQEISWVHNTQWRYKVLLFWAWHILALLIALKERGDCNLPFNFYMSYLFYKHL